MANVRRYMLIEKLPGGGRRISHPSGIVVVETLAQRREHRNGLVRQQRETAESLVVFDAENPEVRTVEVTR